MDATDKDKENNPRLYVGTYAKYNDGSIKGKWLDLTDYKNVTEFFKACEKLHKDESDPEFMFQDFENFPKDLYGESLSIQDMEKIYDWINLEEDDREIVAEYADATGESIDEIDLEQARDSFDTRLEGFNQEKEYGEYVVENGLFEVDMNSPIASYIDYESLGRDYLMDCSVSSNGFVFRSY